MAKRFFYVCAGILLLTIAYQWGARSARAESLGVLVAGSFDPDTDALGIDGNGQMWMLSHNGARLGPLALPKQGTVVEATGANVGGTTFDANVLYADGDAYVYDRSSWRFIGNVLGGATNTPKESWGALKARYHHEEGRK